MLNREHHIPVLTPYNIAVLDGELSEVLRCEVSVVLRMRVRKDKRPEIHCLGCAVTEEDAKAHISCVFRAYYV